MNSKSMLLLWVLMVAFSFVCVVSFLLPLLRPRIVSYPWPQQQQQQGDDDDDKEKTVILAGSYNPPHLGHLAMLSYLGQRYGKVIAVIGINPNKEYRVTPTARADMVRKMLQTETHNISNVQVQVVEGYIWRFAQTVDAALFFRGIRTWKMDGPDERALQILNTWGPLALGPLVWPLPTWYLQGHPDYTHVSSTLVRSVARDRTALLQLVPEAIVSDVAVAYGD